MDKFAVAWKLKEGIPGKINEFAESLLFLKFKIELLIGDKKAKYKDLDNSSCLIFQMAELCNFNEFGKKEVKKSLSKISKNVLTRYYFLYLNQFLREKDYKTINILMNSFVELGLFKEGELIDKQYFKITLLDDRTVIFKTTPVDKECVEAYNGRCFETVEGFARNLDRENKKIALIQEDNVLIGKFYHSILIIGDVVYDLSHDIVISYDNYIDLFKPKVIFVDDSEKVIEEIDQLKENPEFSKSEYCNILKYGILRQQEEKKGSVKTIGTKSSGNK